MTELNQLFRRVYALYLADGWARVPVIEQYLDIGTPDVCSIDDWRSVHDLYRDLAEREPKVLDEVFRHLIGKMRGLPYEHCGGLLDALSFLHHVIGTALWKYSLPVSNELECFAREFDRLDVSRVRRLLYEKAQDECARGERCAFTTCA